MSASDQLSRQWAILRLLSERTDGVSTTEIVRRFAVSKNTAIRDIETLIDSGFAVKTKRVGKRHVYELSEPLRKLADVQVTPLELLSLYAARAQLSPLAGTPVFDDLMQLVQKAHGVVQQGGLRIVDSVSEVFLEHPRGVKSYRQHTETIDALVDAILRRRISTVRYQKPHADEAREHEIRPLKLFFNQGGLYLISLLGPKRHVSTMAVERIVAIEVGRKSFKPPKLDLKERLRGVFGVMDGPEVVVEVEFSAKAAPYIKERIWHPDQQIEPLEGGGVRWTAAVRGKEEIIAWVLSRGPEAKLVRPVEWIEEITRRLEAARAVYGGPG